eukprot:9185736-Alexandrium_andersonii.AAC.1
MWTWSGDLFEHRVVRAQRLLATPKALEHTLAFSCAERLPSSKGGRRPDIVREELRGGATRNG